jgi:hypothetical protein
MLMLISRDTAFCNFTAKARPRKKRKQPPMAGRIVTPAPMRKRLKGPRRDAPANMRTYAG